MFERNFDKLKTNFALKSRASCEKPPLIITIKISSCALRLLRALMQRRAGELPATARRPQPAAM